MGDDLLARKTIEADCCFVEAIRTPSPQVIYQQNRKLAVWHKRLQKRIDLALPMTVIGVRKMGRNGDQQIRIAVIRAVEIGVSKIGQIASIGGMIRAGLIRGN